MNFQYQNAALGMGIDARGLHDLSAFAEIDKVPFMQLLDSNDRAELNRNGWDVETSPNQWVIRKAVEGYGAKVYVVTIRAASQTSVEAHGELFLHSMSCARTAPIHVEHAELAEWLWPLLDATESLNVFSDDDLD